MSFRTHLVVSRRKIPSGFHSFAIIFSLFSLLLLSFHVFPAGVEAGDSGDVSSAYQGGRYSVGYKSLDISPPYAWYWGWDHSNCNPETGMNDRGQPCLNSLPNPGRFPWGPFGAYLMSFGYPSIQGLVGYLDHAQSMRIDENTVGKPVWMSGPIFATSDGASYVNKSVTIECTPTYIAHIPIWKDHIGPYTKWIEEFAREAKNHPSLKFITITHGIDGESYFIKYDDCKNALKAKMAADPSFPNPLEGVDAYKKAITDAYYQNFCDGAYDPIKQICRGKIKPIFVQSTTFGDQAGALGQLMPPMGIKHSAFVADIEDAVFYSNYYRGYGTAETFVRYRNLIPTSIEPRFGNYLLGGEQGTYWFGLEAVWIRPTTIDINPNYGLWGTRQEDPDYFSLMSDHMNVNAVTTPDVWIAFRDTDHLCGAKTQEEYDNNLCVSNGGAPSGSSGIRGDFDFFLRRPDNIPSAKTVLLSRNGYTKNLYSTEIPAGAQTHKFARYVRRTDKATQNYYMFFDVDNNYPWAGQAGQSFLVSVSYLDIGTGDFYLEYKNSQENLVRIPIQRGDSKTWKTAKITIEDASFHENMGLGSDGLGLPTYTDFRIYNGGAGSPDVYLHMVKVKGLGPKPSGAKHSTEILCQTPNTSVLFNEAPEIVAILKDLEGNPIPNQTVRYTLSPFWYTNRISHAQTNAEGRAVNGLNLANTPPLPSSRFIHEVEVTFPGDQNYYASRAICYLPTNYPQVVKRSISASITPTIAKVGDNITVNIKASNGGGAFNVEGEGFGMTACYGNLNGQGQGSCSFKVGGMAIAGERVLGIYASPDGGFGAAATHLVLKVLDEAGAPSPNQYSLWVGKVGTGSGKVNGVGIDCGTDCTESYAPGTTVGLTATADANSTFAGWSGACSGTGTCSLTMNANKALTARFNSNSPLPATSYTITASAGSGGTISPSGTVTVNSGGSKVFAITPNVGYRIADVLVDGAFQGAISSYTFSNVTANHTLDGNFVQEGSGSGANVVLAMNCGGLAYTDKAGVIYRADTGSTGGATYNTTAGIGGTEDGTLYQSERWGNFSYNIPVSNGTYSVTLKFAELYTSNVGGRIFSVKMEGKEVVSNLDLFAKVGKNKAYDVSLPVTVTDGVLNIEFYSAAKNAKVNGILVTSSQSAAQFAITVAAGGGGGVTPSGAVAVTGGGSKTFAITPSAGYYTADVKVDGVSKGAVSSYTFNNVTSDHTLAAKFNPLGAQQYSLTVSKGGTGSGGVSQSPSGVVFSPGTVVTLTASPDAGLVFSGWSGACSGTSPRCTVTMNGNRAVEAAFNESRESGGNGSYTSNFKLDFNGDGQTDILWQHQTRGDVFVWYMQEATFLGDEHIRTVEEPNWKIVGVGDFNGDGKADILWHHQARGDVYVWYMNGKEFIRDQYIRTVEDRDWKIVGVGDFNGDGQPDILWRHQVRGDVYVWYMDGATFLGDQYIRTVGDDLNWRIVGVGDFNGDGKPDILWHHQVRGDVYVWYLDGATFLGDQYIRTVGDDLAWKIEGLGDYNGDGKVDILWRHQVRGDVYVWYMDGATFVRDQYIRSVNRLADDLDWRIVN